MNTKRVDQILTWMKTTDLVEVHYAEGSEVVSLRVADPQAAPVIPPASLLPVTAPAVGVFRFSRPGRPRLAEKDAKVDKNGFLGLIENGKKGTEVSAPAEGRIVRVLVEDGQAVEYGRPLFLIEPS